MQAALDATALTLSKEANGLTQTQLNDKATQYFNANFSNTDAKNITVTPVFTTPQSGNFNLTVTASAIGRPALHERVRPDLVADLVLGGGQMGHQEARACAGARQHRVDGAEQQDDGAEDRVAQPAHHA